MMTALLEKLNLFKKGHKHLNVCIYLFVFILLSLVPLKSKAENLYLIDTYLPLFQFKTSEKLYGNEKFIITGNIYAVKDRNPNSQFKTYLAYEEKLPIIGLRMTAGIEMPIFSQKKWSLHINGKITGVNVHAQYGSIYIRNRWNLEQQIGCGAYYQFNNFLQISVGAYLYRIINDFQYENPSDFYITSQGGLANLRLKF